MIGLWAVWLGVTVAVAFSYGLAWLAIRVAPALGLLDRPDGQRKQHQKPTPLMGGVAIYLALLLSALCTYWLHPQRLPPDAPARATIVMLLVSGGMFCLLGLVDDRWEIGARNKFLWQIAASVPFAVWGRSIDAVQFLQWHLPLGFCAIPFTVLWLVAFSNVINLIDGLDGLAGTIGLLVSLTIAVLAGICGHGVVAVLALLVAGSLAGFLGHNWPPARIFMGDSGSLTVGFLIGALSIESWLKQAAGFTLIVPLVLVSIPMFDTAMAIVRRKLTGRSVGHADRGHIHHRLQDRGLTPLQVLLTLAGLCLAMALVAIASVVVDSQWLAAGLCLSVLLLLIIGRVFGHHEVRLISQYLREREYRHARPVTPKTHRGFTPDSLPVGRAVAGRIGPAQIPARSVQKAA
jgi:UDP-GlcNAc:undecaprenyl-phosphate GlcNAc-1-phosphate transferase